MKTIQRIGRIGRQKRAMSTILAALLLVVITVVLGGIIYAFSSGLVTGLQGQASANQQPTSEKLVLDTYTVYAGNNTVKLYLRNIGGANVTIATSYVRSPSGTLQQVTPSVTSGSLTIQPNAVQPINVVPSAPITFTAGIQNIVTFVTIRGTQFVYDVRA